MSVHMYKYKLQCLYGRNVSSSINVRFYAYCTHYPWIDKFPMYIWYIFYKKVVCADKWFHKKNDRCLD